MNEIETLKQWIDESNNIVFFGGAGVSTESGIPDFRSVDGLYSQKYKYPPETIVSHTFLTKRTDEFFEFYKENQIRVEHIGDLQGLPKDVQEEILNAKADTKDFSGTTCVLAINYGGRDEIRRAANKAFASGKKSLEESDFPKFMDLPELPDVDLLIRTGGEKRLSNFLLWGAAYAEFIFSDTLWPDYSVEEFKKDILDFESRNRRFGGIENKKGAEAAK